MISRNQVQREIDEALSCERRWRAEHDRSDRGSYCESPSKESQQVWRILHSYRQLMSELMNYERQYTTLMDPGRGD